MAPDGRESRHRTGVIADAGAEMLFQDAQCLCQTNAAQAQHSNQADCGNAILQCQVK